MASILWENLTKDFGKVIAVNQLNLECKDGEFLCLLGPSGCGKTTTLRMTAGLETPTSGTIYFDGKPINALSPRDRKIAMVFENYALYPHKSVFKNIAYPLELAGYSKEEIDQKVRRAAKLLEIDAMLERTPKEISGGQKQRVGIARALVREPAAFMMDEPLSHLDAKLRAYMRAELKRLQKELGTTTVFVTHDQLEAMTMADRVAVMDHGILQQHGTPKELYQQPANIFVARFIGEPAMNLIPCELQSEAGRMKLAGEGVSVNVPVELQQRIVATTQSKNLVLGVRPQHVKLHYNGTRGQSLENRIFGTVYITELLGAEMLVRVKTGKDLVHAVAADNIQVKMNDPIELEILPDRFFLFDSESGKRVI